jgi:site-specific DNA-methyltransferase (adenine-specific)
VPQIFPVKDDMADFYEWTEGKTTEVRKAIQCVFEQKFDGETFELEFEDSSEGNEPIVFCYQQLGHSIYAVIEEALENLQENWGSFSLVFRKKDATAPVKLSENAIIWNQDCMKVMQAIPDSSINMILTDIPYGEVNRDSGGLRKFDKEAADEVTFNLTELVGEMCRICSGSFYVFCGQMQLSGIDSTFRQHGLTTRTIVWEKTNPAPINGDKLWISGIELCVFARNSKATFNGSCRNTVIRHPCGTSKVHPTQKPLELFRELVEISSNEGDMIFDACMGSGTTGEAALRMGRKFMGCELNAGYFEIARKRINQTISLLESTLF